MLPRLQRRPGSHRLQRQRQTQRATHPQIPTSASRSRVSPKHRTRVLLANGDPSLAWVHDPLHPLEHVPDVSLLRNPLALFPNASHRWRWCFPHRLLYWKRFIRLLGHTQDQVLYQDTGQVFRASFKVLWLELTNLLHASRWLLLDVALDLRCHRCVEFLFPAACDYRFGVELGLDDGSDEERC